MFPQCKGPAFFFILQLHLFKVIVQHPGRWPGAEDGESRPTRSYFMCSRWPSFPRCDSHHHKLGGSSATLLLNKVISSKCRMGTSLMTSVKSSWSRGKMTTFNAGRSAWKLNQTQVISQGETWILQCKRRGLHGNRSHSGVGKERLFRRGSWMSRSPTLLCVSEEHRLGLHLFSGSLLIWHKPKLGLTWGERKKF